MNKAWSEPSLLSAFFSRQTRAFLPERLSDREAGEPLALASLIVTQITGQAESARRRHSETASVGKGASFFSVCWLKFSLLVTALGVFVAVSASDLSDESIFSINQAINNESVQDSNVSVHGCVPGPLSKWACV